MISAKNQASEVNVACIGVGGAGWFDLRSVSKLAHIAAICDVDEKHLARAADLFPDAARYHDYRELLAKERAIDAVVISTPDHTHAPAALQAMSLGKHCYCQKPLATTIAECRRIASTAMTYGVATQMGTQGVAEPRTREGIEVIRSGLLGEVQEVHVWTDRPGAFWSPALGAAAAATSPTPDGIDWDLWIGTAPYRPYHPSYHPFGWRSFVDFGTGAIGDMGCHNAALPFLGLELGLPISIDGTWSSTSPGRFPAWSELVFEFPGRGSRPAVKLFWYDGGRLPPSELTEEIRLAENGSLVVGSEGKYYSPDWSGSYRYLLPTKRFAAYRPPERTLPRPETHYAEWIMACKGEAPALCNFFDFGATLTEILLLGNLAIRLGGKIYWDAERGCVIDRPDANQYIDRAYREGWELFELPNGRSERNGNHTGLDVQRTL